MTHHPSVPAVRREVLVRAGPAEAFTRFTDDIGRWWPLAGHSVSGEGGTVAFTGGRLVETDPTASCRSGVRCWTGSRRTGSG